MSPIQEETSIPTRDGKTVAEWASEAALLIGEYGRATKRGDIANQCNRVASRLLASVADTLEGRDALYEALRLFLSPYDGFEGVELAKRCDRATEDRVIIGRRALAQASPPTGSEETK